MGPIERGHFPTFRTYTISYKSQSFDRYMLFLCIFINGRPYIEFIFHLPNIYQLQIQVKDWDHICYMTYHYMLLIICLYKWASLDRGHFLHFPNIYQLQISVLLLLYGISNLYKSASIDRGYFLHISTISKLQTLALRFISF